MPNQSACTEPNCAHSASTCGRGRWKSERGLAARAADALAGPAFTFADMQDLKPLSARQMPANLGIAFFRYRLLRKVLKPLR